MKPAVYETVCARLELTLDSERLYVSCGGEQAPFTRRLDGSDGPLVDDGDAYQVELQLTDHSVGLRFSGDKGGQANTGYDPRFGQSRNDGLALFLGGRQILPPLSGRDTRPSGAALAEATRAPAPAPPARAPPEPWPPHLRRLMSGARLWRGGLVYFLPGGRNLGHGPNTYGFEPDGGMVLHAIIFSPYLPDDLSWSLRYRRVSAEEGPR